MNEIHFFLSMFIEDLDSEIFSAVPVATATGQTELRPKEIKGEPSPLHEPSMPTAAPIGTHEESVTIILYKLTHKYKCNKPSERLTLISQYFSLFRQVG